MRVSFIAGIIPINDPHAAAECLTWIETAGFFYKCSMQGIVKTSHLAPGRQNLQPVNFIFAECDEIKFQIFFGEPYSQEVARRTPELIRARVEREEAA